MLVDQRLQSLDAHEGKILAPARESPALMAEEWVYVTVAQVF